MSDCIFCKNLPKVLENELAYAVFDIKPITKGHLLVIPKRHHVTAFESTPEEIKAIMQKYAKVRVSGKKAGKRDKNE